jgi:uncharacterized protein YigE (DUF2233 family)
MSITCQEVAFDGARFLCCRLDPRVDRLHVFCWDEKRVPFGSFARLETWLSRRGQRLALAMNAGIYQTDLTPLGLAVAEGRTLRRLNRAHGFGNFYLKPNGVFALTAQGARVVRTDDYARLVDVRCATQSGPLLVHGGTLHAAFQEGSLNRLIRNGVGVAGPNTIWFSIAQTPVNFHTFARLFRDRLGCPDALYLDGNVSSLYAPALARHDAHTPLGPILAVVTP